MSKRKSKQKQTKNPEPNKLEQSKRPKAAWILAVLVVFAGAAVWWLYGSASGPDLQSLVGLWARTDGTYKIEVRSVAADGTVDAAYYNPRTIHVAQASASAEGSISNLFIELQDVGYPGSTYTLRYDAENDVLAGIYSQAAMGQEFQVAFVRLE